MCTDCQFDASFSGWPNGWAFFVGLLQAAYTLTGYGMVAALCEEVKEPQIEVPRAMVFSVIAAGITGLVYLLPIIFVLPDIEPLLNVASLQPMPLLYKTVTGSAAGAMGLLTLILGIWFFAAVGSLTAASRCTWAFSRDGGIPFSHWWKTVNPKYDVPIPALGLSTIVCALLGLIYLGSSAAFNAFTGVATICLGCSYAFPVLCSLLRRREQVKDAPFSLGKFGYVINITTVIWITFSILLFCFRESLQFDALLEDRADILSHCHPRHPDVDELCLGRVRRLLAHCRYLVPRQRAQALQGPHGLAAPQRAGACAPHLNQYGLFPVLPAISITKQQTCPPYSCRE